MISSKLVILAIVSSVLAAPAPQLITASNISSLPELTSATSPTFIPSTLSPSGNDTTTFDSSPVSSLVPPTSVPQISGISTTSSTLPGTILTSAPGELPSSECSGVPSIITVIETISATSAPVTTILGSAVTSDVGASSVVSTVTDDTGSEPTVLLSSTASTVTITGSAVSISSTAVPSELTSSFIDVPSGVVSSFTEEPSSAITSSIATF